MKGTIKFIDLFAGIGGTRCGMETRGTLFFDVERI